MVHRSPHPRAGGVPAVAPFPGPRPLSLRGLDTLPRTEDAPDVEVRALALSPKTGRFPEGKVSQTVGIRPAE